jgi:HEAT repeat protein
MRWRTIRKLRSQKPEVRSHALRALADFGSPHIVELLLCSLIDLDSNVRHEAEQALRRSKIELDKSDGARAAVPALTAALEASDDNIRNNAVRALGGIRDIRAVMPLRKCLAKAISQGEIVDALASVCSTEVLPVVLDAAAAIPIVYQRLHQVLENALVQLGLPAVEGLVIALGATDPRTRALAVAALGRIPGSDASSAVLALLDDEYCYVRKNARRVLDLLNWRPSVPTLMRQFSWS